MKAKCFKCGKEGHYGSVSRSRSKVARINELQVQSAAAPGCMDCVLDEYEPVYFNAPIHHLKSVTVESLNDPKSEPHIRLLWLSQESSSEIFRIDCKVATGARYNSVPLHKTIALSGEDLKLGTGTVNLKGYNDIPVENWGPALCTFTMVTSCTDRVSCEVTDREGHMILGRKQALDMEYVRFP